MISRARHPRRASIEERGCAGALVAGVVAAAIVAPVLQALLQRTAVGGFGASLALLPLTLGLALSWWRLRPAAARLRVPVNLGIAVLASGPFLACLLALALRRPLVLPHPLVAAEIALLAALEELLFHGVLLTLGLWLVRRWLSGTSSVLVVLVGLAVIFALAHPGTEGPVLASRLWAGVLGGSLVLVTGRLWPAVALHAGFNLYAHVALPVTTSTVLLAIGALWMTAATALLLVAGRRCSAEDVEGEAASAEVDERAAVVPSDRGGDVVDRTQPAGVFEQVADDQAAGLLRQVRDHRPATVHLGPDTHHDVPPGGRTAR